jgi:hypothetical protein
LLAQVYGRFKQQVDDLAASPTDGIFVRGHLVTLRTQLTPHLADAGEILEGLQDLIDTDYAEQVRAKDQGGPPFDASDKPVLVQDAMRLLEEIDQGPAVSRIRLQELLEPLAGEKAAYASILMQEKGTPADPGLGLLRFAMARLDEGSSLAAQQCLDRTVTLRSLVEEAYRLREEWRVSGPARLGDAALFGFFLTVIDQTNLGKAPIPPAIDWEKLGKLKDRNLLTLQLT